MIGREVLSTALHRFRTHPLQTWLTLAGLIVGTAAIIITMPGLSARSCSVVLPTLSATVASVSPCWIV